MESLNPLFMRISRPRLVTFAVPPTNHAAAFGPEHNVPPAQLPVLLLIITSLYSLSSVGWSITAGADSPVQSNMKGVMPAFLTAEADTKTLVLREVGAENSKSIQYYISRGEDISLGEPDVAPGQVRAIELAAQELIDGSGISSSQVFSSYGIKYVFVKNPFSRNVIRTIDGLGGFARTSATSAGVVWRVTGVTGRIIFTAKDGPLFSYMLITPVSFVPLKLFIKTIFPVLIATDFAKYNPDSSIILDVFIF